MQRSEKRILTTHVGSLPRQRELSDLLIAQDTGAAIKGAARGDIFFGSGEAAGEMAGRVRHPADCQLAL